VLRSAQRSARGALTVAVEKARVLDTRRLDTLNSVGGGYLLAHESLLQRELSQLSHAASEMQGVSVEPDKRQMGKAAVGWHCSPCDCAVRVVQNTN
jgi:hypothetical protein